MMTVNEFLSSVNDHTKQIFLFFANENPIGPLYSKDRVTNKQNVEIHDIYEKDGIVYLNSYEKREA